jgi:hypothetical protein
MKKVDNNFINKHKDKLDSSFFQQYSEETRVVKKEKIDYKVDEKYYRRWKLEFLLGEEMPNGTMADSFFRKGNFIYSMLGMSHARGGPHSFDCIRATAIGNKNFRGGSIENGDQRTATYSKVYEYGGREIYKYDLEHDKWTTIGRLKDIKPMGGMINWTYNCKFYLLGGYSFQKMNPQFLKQYQEKYGKWPDKKGEWYSSDLREITITDKNEIIENTIPLKMFTNTIMSHLQIGDKIFFTAGVNGKKQKCWLSSSELNEYIIDSKWKKKISKMGNKIYLGSILFFIDMNEIEKGLQIETIFPGIPCMSYELNEYNDYIYYFSSHTYSTSSWSSFRPGERNRASCPNNWKYNLKDKKWTRISDWPFPAHCSKKVINVGDVSFILGGNNGFMKTSIDYMKKNNKNFEYFTEDNYSEMVEKIPEIKIIYEKNKDGIWKCKDNEIDAFFKFGTCTNHFSLFNHNDQKTVTSLENIKSYDYFQHYFSDIIAFYDFKQDKFYLSDHNLPMNIGACTSKHVVYNNHVYLFGGESNDILFNNKFPMISSCLVHKIKYDKYLKEGVYNKNIGGPGYFS